MMRTPAYRASIGAALEAAERYLAGMQWPDGSWREYRLVPGPSEGWTTAFVLFSLASSPSNRDLNPILMAGAKSLYTSRQREGWGYNRETPTDADSTAWAVRALAVTDGLRGTSMGPMLLKYLDAAFHAHTHLALERESGSDSWTGRHDDVTPVVGLALLAIGHAHGDIQRVRNAVLEARTPKGTWKSFWWTTDAYANAKACEFLAASGGIPTDVRQHLVPWLDAYSFRTALDAAQCLALATELLVGDHPIVSYWLETVCNAQRADGSWPPSDALVLPPHGPEDHLGSQTAADEDGLVTTAASVCALKRWLVRASALALREPLAVYR